MYKLGKSSFRLSKESGLGAMFNEKELASALRQFLNNDSLFRDEIRQSMLHRLKYATGKTYESIDFDIDVGVKVEDGQFTVDISALLLDEDKLGALLSEEEAEEQGLTDVPTVPDLVQYIDAKRSYYNDEIDRRRQNMQIVLQRQKTLLHEQQQRAYRAGQKELTPEQRAADEERKRKQTIRLLKFAKDPVLSLAEQIHNAIQSRVDRGKAPTRGSESVLMGHYEITDLTTGKKITKPKYSRFSPPLYTISTDEGVINEAIQRAFQSFADSVFSKQIQEAIVDGRFGDNFIDILYNIFKDAKLNAESKDFLSRTFKRDEGLYKWFEKQHKDAIMLDDKAGFMQMLDLLDERGIAKQNVYADLMLSKRDAMSEIRKSVREVYRKSLAQKRWKVGRRAKIR